MATASKGKLSASTDGKGIKIAAVATAGTLLHTATASTTNVWDEIWIWIFNSDTSVQNVTIEFGGATAPDWNIVQQIPSKCGLVLVVPGLVLQNATTVKAFATLTNVLTANGFVNTVTN